MAKKDRFKSEDTYRVYKRKEYARYYESTQLYERRKWEDEEVLFLINNYKLPTRELSAEMQRSIKSIEHCKRILCDKHLLPVLN